MMLHRHFEEMKRKNENITYSHDVTPRSTSTDPTDPLYVPVDEPVREAEDRPRRGRPRKV